MMQRMRAHGLQGKDETTHRGKRAQGASSAYAFAAGHRVSRPTHKVRIDGAHVAARLAAMRG